MRKLTSTSSAAVTTDRTYSRKSLGSILYFIEHTHIVDRKVLHLEKRKDENLAFQRKNWGSASAFADDPAHVMKYINKVASPARSSMRRSHNRIISASRDYFTMQLITYLLHILLPLVFSGVGVSGAASPNRDTVGAGGELIDIYQFSNNGSFIDNIVFRPDGTLLLTRIDVPQVWSVDPQTGAGSLTYDFSEESTKISSCFGITEIEYDVFTVVAGQFDVETFSATPGSFGIWKLDFTVDHENADSNFDCRLKQTSTPTVTKIVEIPQAKALGASTLFASKKSRYLLLSDSPEGIIWKLDLKTGKYSPTLSDGSMLPVPNGPAMGVNGIKVFDGYLYYASVTRRELRRVRIDNTASAIGPYELIRDNIGLDSLDISIEGDIYLALNTENMIMSLTTEGKLVQVAGDTNSTLLAGPTCCVLHPSGNALFVGTNGGLFAPVDGWFEEPGKVSAIRI